MERRLSRLRFWVVFVLGLFLMGISIFDNRVDAKISLEQVYTKAPFLYVFVSDDSSADAKKKSFRLEFDGKELVYQNDLQKHDPNKEIGVDYYYVIENSKFVSKKQREDIVSQLQQSVKVLSGADRIRIYTFGDKFSAEDFIEISGSATLKNRREALDKVRQLLKKKENTSHLWNAMTNIIQTINKDTTEQGRRRVALFITGGNYIKSTSNNDKEDVKNQISSMTENAAFYMLQLKTKSKIDGSEASVFTSSGGEKYSEKILKGIPICFEKFRKRIKETKVASFLAEDNTVFDKSGVVSLWVDDEVVCENKKIAATTSWKENTEPPVLIPIQEGTENYITKEDGYTISFKFSEPVRGVEVIQNYSLKNRVGDNINIKSLKYDVKTYQCFLTLEREIFEDHYQLKLTNITDIDHTPLKVEPSVIEFDLQGKSEKLYNFVEFLKNYWWIILIVLCVIVLLIVYFVIRSHGGIVEQEDGKMGFANATTVTVGISTPKTKKILLQMTDSHGRGKDIVCNIDSSIFVGRDKMCQIHTDDDKMSRQHFAIESTQLGFYVMDLDTLNGTFVNGTKLTDRQMLKEGDVISAGREKFVFGLYKGE